MEPKEPPSPDPGPEPVDEQPAPAQEQVRMQRGVLVVPFIIATGLTFLILMGTGQTVRGTWVLVPLIVGAVVAAASLAWSASKRPVTAQSVARASSPQEQHDEREGEDDPLAHIHVVEDQARRHTKPCPNCGTSAGTGLERCPNCDHILLVECKGCRTKVRLEWGACPECGKDLP